MIKLGFTTLLLVLVTRTFAQTYEKEYVTLFAYQVKQIDEFIARFNDEDSTLIKLYYKKYNPSKELTREELIKSLFNYEKKWNYQEINHFIDTVDNQINPLKLSKIGNNWYVKLNCPVTWNGLSKTAILTLKLVPVRNNIYKWVITGVSAPFLRPVKYARYDGATLFPAPQDSTTAINAVSNAIDFMNIDDVTTYSENISNYFQHSATYRDDLPLFVNECLKKHLTLSSPISIEYFFAQIPGWLLEIKQYNRRNKNSGWLISALVKTNPAGKKQHETTP